MTLHYYSFKMELYPLVIGKCYSVIPTIYFEKENLTQVVIVSEIS